MHPLALDKPFVKQGRVFEIVFYIFPAAGSTINHACANICSGFKCALHVFIDTIPARFHERFDILVKCPAQVFAASGKQCDFWELENLDKSPQGLLRAQRT